jgi:aminoglycoside phosphotransferase (APT) family kinase protein
MATRPRVHETVLVHSNLHPGNVLSTGDRNVVIDWARAQLDDPHYDVAATMLIFRIAPTRMRGVAPRAVARMSERMMARFVRRYVLLSGRSLDAKRLDWFEGLVATRVLLEATAARRAAGGELEAGYALMEDVVRERYTADKMLARFRSRS